MSEVPPRAKYYRNTRSLAKKSCGAKLDGDSKSIETNRLPSVGRGY